MITKILPTIPSPNDLIQKFNDFHLKMRTTLKIQTTCFNFVRYKKRKCQEVHSNKIPYYCAKVISSSISHTSEQPILLISSRKKTNQLQIYVHIQYRSFPMALSYEKYQDTLFPQTRIQKKILVLSLLSSLLFLSFHCIQKKSTVLQRMRCVNDVKVNSKYTQKHQISIIIMSGPVLRQQYKRKKILCHTHPSLL